MQSLNGLALEPIDVVLMSDDLSGDAQSSLERYLVARFRVAHSVPDERTTVILPATGAVDAAKTLAIDFSGAAAYWRRTPEAPAARLRADHRARPLHAGDSRRAADAPTAGPAIEGPRAATRASCSLRPAARLDAAIADLNTAWQKVDAALTEIAAACCS